MKIDNLRAFITVATTGNITKAAENLFMSQQNLSFMIKNMEKEVNCPLLVRNPNKRIFLTQDGQEFLETAKEIVLLYDTFVSKRNITMPKAIYNLYTTPALAGRLSERQMQLSQNGVYISIHRRNYNELIDLINKSNEGFFLLPVVSIGPKLFPEDERKLYWKKNEKSCVTIVHKASPLAHKEISIDVLKKYTRLVDTYYVGKENQRTVVIEDINLCKKLMQQKGFYYDTTYSVWKKYFDESGEWAIIDKRDEQVEYRLYVNKGTEITDVQIEEFLFQLRKI